MSSDHPLAYLMAMRAYAFLEERARAGEIDLLDPEGELEDGPFWVVGRLSGSRGRVLIEPYDKGPDLWPEIPAPGPRLPGAYARAAPGLGDPCDVVVVPARGERAVQSDWPAALREALEG